MADKRYYWLKLKRSFFNRHDIKILEAMPNGKEYVLFYLKLMCESIDHDGRLRFSDETPYTREMLAPLTNTKIEIVESAIEVLFELGMIECDDDKTYHIKGVENMIGSAVDNDNARRQARYRDKQKDECVTKNNEDVTECVTKSNESKSKSKSKSKNNIYVHAISKKEFEEQCSNEFKGLWDMYPRKQGKTNAWKAYLKARLNGSVYSDIENGLKNYVAYIKKNKTEARYIKMGSTWFNQKCWEDSYDNHGGNQGLKGEDNRPFADQETDDWFFNRN